ncbi:MAG TPA: hypothetical protein PKX78_00450 [Candidatus Woesebacteria bacterium]|nr:hypothetical protein [Candidatus Woesebacteria bacterium]
MGTIALYDKARQSGQENPDELSSVSVEQLLRQEGWTFNQENFQEQVVAAKDKVLNTGGGRVYPAIVWYALSRRKYFQGRCFTSSLRNRLFSFIFK